MSPSIRSRRYLLTGSTSRPAPSRTSHGNPGPGPPTTSPIRGSRARPSISSTCAREPSPDNGMQRSSRSSRPASSRHSSWCSQRCSGVRSPRRQTVTIAEGSASSTVAAGTGTSWRSSLRPTRSGCAGSARAGRAGCWTGGPGMSSLPASSPGPAMAEPVIVVVHGPDRLSWFISRRLVSRAAASSSSRSSSARRRSRTAWRSVSSSSRAAAVLAGAPRPLRSKACWPSSSDSRSSRSLTCWASLRFCSCRLAFSASTDRWLIAVDAGDGSVVASAAALRTAACRSGCRCMNERCTLALSATAEMVISDPSARISASAWWTRCRRRSTSRRRAFASGVSALVMVWSSGFGGRADGGHAEADELAGLADHRDRVGDPVTVLLGEVGDVGLDTADQVPQLGDLFLARGELGSGPVLQFGGGLDLFPVGEQLLQVGLELGQVGRVAADPVDSGPDPLFGDAVVPESCLDGIVAEQVTQHVGGYSLVGVPLGEGYLYLIL